MDTVLDIFRGDGFTVTSVDRIVKNATYVPQALGAMGIFTPNPIKTKGVEIFQDSETLRLIPTTERGTADVEQLRDQGTIVNLRTFRFAKKDRVTAAELQDLIADWQQPNSTQALADATTLVTKRLSKLKAEMEMTMEQQRLGALQGILVDADGVTVLQNFFTAFGISAPTTISVDFAGLAAPNFFQYFGDTFQRPIVRSLKDRKVPGMGICALVGDYFWSKLMTHLGFYNAVMTAQQGRNLIFQQDSQITGAQSWQQVFFAGITWINYMGTDDGTTIAVPPRQAIFFPTNVPDVWRQYMSPGETLNDVNQPGQPWYAYVTPDNSGMNEHVDIRLRSYPLFSAIFPQALMRAQVATGQ